jgi:S-DNA-T family DNA segregation ATPase FtsK/SpoIIIE
MARKPAEETLEHRGLNDVLGIVLLAFAVLLAVALFSFDRRDLPFVTSSPNHPPHNWIGPIGAYSAYALFFIVGGGAYLIPVLLLCFGLAGFFQIMAFLRHRWWLGLALLFACTGMLDLYSGELNLAVHAGRAGGLLGEVMNRLLFNHFGRVGATIIFATVYLISLLSLTNFRLGSWILEQWERRRPPAAGSENIGDEEKVLGRRARELQKEALSLPEQAEKAACKQALAAPTGEKPNLGADLQPVPEPMIRDLSVPQARVKAGRSPSREREEPTQDVNEARGSCFQPKMLTK